MILMVVISLFPFSFSFPLFCKWSLQISDFIVLCAIYYLCVCARARASAHADIAILLVLPSFFCNAGCVLEVPPMHAEVNYMFFQFMLLHVHFVQSVMRS